MGDSFAPFLIFIVIIVVNIIRSRAKREEQRRKREADELRKIRQRQLQEQEINREPASLYENAKREAVSQPTSGDIFKEIFRGMEGGPLSDLFREDQERKTPASPQIPVYKMGEATEGSYGKSSSLEGKAYDGSDRSGSLLTSNDFEGRSLVNEYGESLPLSGVFKGLSITEDKVKNPASRNMTSAPKPAAKKNPQRASAAGGLFNGHLCKADIVRGIVMAEVLGPPRAKRPQIR